MQKIRGGVNHPNFQDLTGKINGQLTIVKYVNRPKPNGKAQWLWECNCSCGETIYVRTARLNGTEASQERCKKCQYKINSKNRVLLNYMQIRNFLYFQYQQKAKKRNNEFNISFEDFDKMIQQNCYYCGQAPEAHKGDLIRLQEKEPFKRNGIDRVDSNKGYTLDNIVPCCTMCNFAKLHYSIDEFSEWLKKLYKYQTKVKQLNVF